MKTCFSAIALVFAFSIVNALAEDRWYRGNTHTHTLWSDGNDFPEMIVDWYKKAGYDFLALSDHNILAVSEKWMTLEAIEKRQRTVARRAIDKYRAHFGGDWVETRTPDGGAEEVRLKRIDEFRPLYEEPGKFLLVQAEEISSSAQGKPVHINAINLPGKNTIPAVKSDAPVQEVMRENLRAVAEREKETGQPIMTHLNHPNFGWAITAEDLGHVLEERFFEVYNGHPGIRHLGDEEHPGDEKIWDIANTIRIAEHNSAPLFGVATDDSHTYHGGPVSPGRGWVMVRAEELTGDALVLAMRAGNFYASSGVFVKSFGYDAESRTLSIEIEPVDGVEFKTELIGTRKGTEPATAGEVFSEMTGVSLKFEVPADALYARATITSTRNHPNPSIEDQKEQAWLQPVGWRR
ncbi:MAG: hypothetical protein ACI8UO_002905 [Verrucomicrobiales bacterium]|jgi:hypothetical protein